MVPKGWISTTIEEIATVSSGGTPSRAKQEYWGGTIPWLTTSKINYEVITEADEYITELGLKNSSTRIYPKGSLLMAMYGQGATRGRVGILGIDASINQACACLEPKDTGVVLVDYLYFFFKYRYHHIRNLSHGGNQLNLSGELIKAMNVLLPPYKEQQGIVKLLSIWELLIKKTALLIDAKEKQKWGFIQQLFTGKKRFKEFEGKAWKSSSFGSTFNAKVKKNVCSAIDNPITVGKYAIKRQSEHFTRTVASKDTSNYNIIEKNDFVYDPMSAYYGAIGRYDLDEPGIVSPVYRVMVLKENHDSEFFKYLVKSHLVSFKLSANSSQGNKSGKRRGISEHAFNAIHFEIPDLEEQEKIGQLFFNLDKENNLLKQKMKMIQKQKTGLMQKLLTGQVRVKV